MVLCGIYTDEGERIMYSVVKREQYSCNQMGSETERIIAIAKLVPTGDADFRLFSEQLIIFC